LEHFISRKAMDIDGLGEETIDLLFEKKLVLNFPDLYNLKTDQLIQLERLGEKSAANILNSIKKSINTPYYRVLYALGIRHVGETMAKTIARRFRSIDELMKAGFEELTAVPEIGPKIASSINAYFSDSENIDIVNRLKAAGIRFYDNNEVTVEGNSLNNNIIVISGLFHLHSREEYKTMIEKNGGKVSSSVSGNTTFILAGENMGTSKKEKATELGIRMISESDFLKIIGEE